MYVCIRVYVCVVRLLYRLSFILSSSKVGCFTHLYEKEYRVEGQREGGERQSAAVRIDEVISMRRA